MNAIAPDPIIDSILAYRRSKVLMVGAYFGFFDKLRTPRSAAALARNLGLRGRPTEIVLDALAASGYLKKSGGRYANAPIANRFLVSGRPGTLADNLKYQEIISEAWQDLRGCLERGSARRPLSYWLSEHEGFTREYIRGMANIARTPAREIAEAVPLARGARLLDLGCGPGSYSVEFLSRYPGTQATLFDLPGTLKITRPLLRAREALRGRWRLQAGDYTEGSFGVEAFDAALLSHITHDESPSTNLKMLRACRRALRPGGRAIIHDFVVAPKRTRPEFGALFSVHMLAYTSGGRTYTTGEYRRWLQQAGFKKIWTRAIGRASRNATRIIVGTKAP